MSKRRVITDRAYAHFVTFSCHKRRQLLQPDRTKKIVMAALDEEIRRHEGCCIGFVIMPDHVHAMIWLPESQAISSFMDRWKERSSKRIQAYYKQHFATYWSKLEDNHVWQARYYDFNIESSSKVEEKLAYMHANPVRAGLAPRPEDWPYSSARYYSLSTSVGVKISSPAGAFE